MGIRHRRGRDATRDFEVDYDEHSAVATGAEQEAAGVTAVMVSLRRGLKAMGPFRTAASLLRLNQRKGIDCPGCAWPEEHDGRKFAEFCENGAKDDRVDLVSEFTNGDGRLQERTAKDFMVVAYSTPVGNAAASYPETNALVPLDHTAARSNTPVSKAIVIRLDKAWDG